MQLFPQIWAVWQLASMPSTRQIATAMVVTLAFATLGRLVRGVNQSGAIAGAIICFILYLGGGPGAFIALVALFLLAWLSTRWGYAQKQKLGMAEKREGRRATQVFANLSVAAICAGAHLMDGRAIFLLGVAAALSEAAADTVSSEIGQASSSQARLVTTWRVVPAGTDGGITLAGTMAGLLAASIVSLSCALTGLISWKGLGISILAAMAGMLADSWMGAWLEQRKVLNNDTVNFLGTAIAAAIALSIS